jgi:hypothetical protein
LVDAHSRPKTLVFNDIDNTEEHFPIEDDENKTRSLSNAIIFEQTYDTTKTIEQSDILNSSVLSQSAPLGNTNTNNIRISQSDGHTSDFYTHDGYSPNSSYQR